MKHKVFLTAMAVLVVGGIAYAFESQVVVDGDKRANYVYDLGPGGSGGGAATVANGADVAEGSTTDAAATAGGTGTLSAKLRLLTSQIDTMQATMEFVESYTQAQTQTIDTNANRVKILDDAGNPVSWGPPDAGDLAPTGGGAGSAVSVTTSSTTVWLATDSTVREMFVTALPTNTSYILCGIAAEAVTDTVFSHVLYPSQTLDTGLDGSITEIRCKAPTGAASQSVAVAKLTGE